MFRRNCFFLAASERVVLSSVGMTTQTSKVPPKNTTPIVSAALPVGFKKSSIDRKTMQDFDDKMEEVKNNTVY